MGFNSYANLFQECIYKCLFQNIFWLRCVSDQNYSISILIKSSFSSSFDIKAQCFNSFVEDYF